MVEKCFGKENVRMYSRDLIEKWLKNVLESHSKKFTTVHKLLVLVGHDPSVDGVPCLTII